MVHKVFDPTKFRQQLIAKDAAREEEILGCSPSEIEKILSTKPHVRPPDDYLVFLKFFGKKAGNLFRGSDIYYPDCLKFNEYADEFSREEDPALTTEGRFFFSVHQGYVLYFFQGKERGVWSYSEGSGCANQISESFSEFLCEEIDHPPSDWQRARDQDKRSEEIKRGRNRT